jgi:hypothetical protein
LRIMRRHPFGREREGGPARPVVDARPQEMLARLFREALDLVEVDDHQAGEVGQLEGVEPLVVAAQSREVAQPQGAQLVLSPLECRRQVLRVHAPPLHPHNSREFRRVTS